jgi:hypothetical protein
MVDDGLAPGSLERLEMELQELLRGRRAPVSIASLPQLYYERFGKTLQAEGYLTESQRHGKAGYSLTKLLARLKNTVTLIDRYVFSFVVQNQPFRMSIRLSTHEFCEWAVLGRWGQWGVGIMCSFEDSRASSWGGRVG